LVSFVSVGLIGTLIAIFPDLWVNIFTGDAGCAPQPAISVDRCADVRVHRARDIDVFFHRRARQGCRPVLAQSARLLFIGVGGWWLSTHHATATNYFALAATSMVVLGVLSASSVFLTDGSPKGAPFGKFAPHCRASSTRA